MVKDYNIREMCLPQQHLYWNKNYYSVTQFQMHTEVQDVYHVIWRFFSWKHQYQEQIIRESSQNIPHQELYHFIILMDLFTKTDKFKSRSKKACTAWNRNPSLPIRNVFLTWSHMDITQFRSRLDYGPTKQEKHFFPPCGWFQCKMFQQIWCRPSS